MASVNIDIPDGFRALCDRVTEHGHSVSWVIFHTGRAKGTSQVKPEIQLLGQSDGLLPPSEILDNIREAIKKEAGDGIPIPQFILCNLPVTSQGLKKNLLCFISLCHEGTTAFVNFTHASTLQPIVEKLGLNPKVHRNRAIPISNLDELDLAHLEPKAAYDEPQRHGGTPLMGSRDSNVQV